MELEGKHKMNDYDYLTAMISGIKPQKVNDNEYHWPTRDPKSGKILKKLNHPTLLMGLLEDMKLGYKPYVSPDGNLYTLDKKEYFRKALSDYIGIGSKK